LEQAFPGAPLGGGRRRRHRQRPVAQKLVAVGEEVVDVPPKLSAKVRVLSVGNARKRTIA
jgi:hypothetical protein